MSVSFQIKQLRYPSSAAKNHPPLAEAVILSKKKFSKPAISLSFWANTIGWLKPPSPKRIGGCHPTLRGSDNRGADLRRGGVASEACGPHRSQVERLVAAHIVRRNKACAWHDQQIGGVNPILEARMEGIQHRCGKGQRKTEGPVEAVGALAFRMKVKHRKALAVGKLVPSSEARYPSVPPAYW